LDGSLVKYGTSSFSSRDWVGPFYEPGTQPSEYLRQYSNSFDTVEVDATYYAVPSQDTVMGWVDKTPDDFVISAKFPRSIVHAGKEWLPDAGKLLLPDETYDTRDRFLGVMAHADSKVGMLLLQFPYFSKKVFTSRNEFMDRLDRFLGDLPESFRYAVEIRNKSWLTKPFADLLRSHSVAMAHADHAWMPHADEIDPKIEPVTADVAYVRLIGDRKEIEAITKTWEKEVIDRTDRLERWADHLISLLRKEIRTLVYINNHYAGHAPATVRRLVAMVRERLN